MRYFRVDADLVSTKRDAVLVGTVDGFAMVTGLPDLAQEGKPFCVIDSSSAGRCQGKAWVPLDEEIKGFRTHVIDARPTIVHLEEGMEVFENFEDAVRDGLLRTPVATATVRLESFVGDVVFDDPGDVPVDKLKGLLELASEMDVESDVQYAASEGIVVTGEMRKAAEDIVGVGDDDGERP